MGEGGGRGGGREEAVEGFGGGAGDGGYDEVACVGEVLVYVLDGFGVWGLGFGSRGRGGFTLPLLNSIEAAFFLLSVTRAPAMVAVTVSGGIWRRPGPIVNVFFLPVPCGKALFGISSPGRTIVGETAMVKGGYMLV